MIGELTERISFMVPLTAKSATTGETLTTFVTSSAVWGSFNYLATGSGEENLANRKTDITKVKVGAYYNSAIRSTYQVIYENKEYEIKAIYPDEDNMFMTLEAESVKPHRNVYYTSLVDGFWTDPFGNYWVAIDRGADQPIFGNLTWTNALGDTWTTV